MPPDFVLITTATGVVIDLVPTIDAGDDISVFKGILTPGFINAHCHVELSHLKGTIATGTGLVAFVQQVMGNRTPLNEDRLIAMQQAVNEMYNSGIVAIGDICNTTDSIGVKLKSGLHWQNFIEVSGFVPAGAQKRLADANLVYDTFLQHQLKASLSPHAPYSVSSNLFKVLNEATSQQLISIHNQECAAEDELYLHKTGGFLDLYNNFGIDIRGFNATGKTSLQSWLPNFTQQQSIISVHNSFTSQADLDFYIQQQLVTTNARLFFCLCVNANKYIEQKIPPIELLRNNRCDIVLGTDSYASNWQLNIMEEIKTLQAETKNRIPLPELLQWATSNGARALQLDKTLGSFEKNKQPGIILIEGIENLSNLSQASSKRIL